MCPSNFIMENSKVKQSWCWLLDKDEYETIYKSFVPIYTEALSEIISSFNPEPITQQLGPKNKIAVGVICVNDAYDFLKEAWWLLHEAFCYFQHINRIKKNELFFIPRIYADDTCLRLYSSSEHLASAIVNILEIDLLRSEGIKSLACRVGNYFLQELPQHELSSSIKKLVTTKEWQDIIRWRNDWVHNKRVIPTESPEYKRHNLWKQTNASTFELFVGPKRQTESDQDFENILKTTRTALNVYVACFSEMAAFLKDYICNDIFKGHLTYSMKKDGESLQIPSFKYRLGIKPFEP
jgi:hypothetical protein